LFHDIVCSRLIIEILYMSKNRKLSKTTTFIQHTIKRFHRGQMPKSEPRGNLLLMLHVLVCYQMSHSKYMLYTKNEILAYYICVKLWRTFIRCCIIDANRVFECWTRYPSLNNIYIPGNSFLRAKIYGLKNLWKTQTRFK